MRLLSTIALLAAKGVLATHNCMICEYIGVASTEADAALILAGNPPPSTITDPTTQDEARHISNPCAAGQLSEAFDEAVATGEVVLDEAAVYCVADFFLFHAKDIDRYIYGVQRSVSTSGVSPSQIDLSHYEGIKAWTLATQRSAGSAAGNVAAISEASNAENAGACNPRYTIRGTYQRIVDAANPYVDVTEDLTDDTTFGAYQVFGMDGREPKPSDFTARETNTQPTTESVQATPYTLCLVCNGAQEFSTQPTVSSDITNVCWNPSGSSIFKTDDVTARDVKKYCVPNNGLCRTNTWQYSTKDYLKVTSYWIGIQRGCQEDIDGSTTGDVVSYVTEGTGFAHGTNRAADGMTKFVRYFAATNTAAKAKDNAKYPDAGTNSGSTVSIKPFAFTSGYSATNVYIYDDASKVTTVSYDTAEGTAAKNYYYKYGYVGLGFTGSSTTNNLKDASNADCSGVFACSRSLIQTITPQFMSSDGSGPPDVPEIQDAVLELECLSCATPLINTNSENNCVTAKTDLTVKCKTLSCSAIVSNYKLDSSETAETYYYAKRGCAADPEDGISTGDQTQADQYVIPAGYTGIKQTNQRVTSKNANTIQASSASIATIMDCYSCNVDMKAVITGSNPTEPSYDSIKTQDTSLCWQTFPPQTDSSISATGTSGRCETSCYVSAYKYKETTGSTTNPVSTFYWKLERGCARVDLPITTGTVPSNDLFGVSITNYACDYRNGTLCNSQLEAYDTTLQLKTQTVRKIQCYVCETPAGNSDLTHTCYTVPSTEKALDCPDLSYVSCFATETAFNSSSTVSVYGMQRGCSKEPPGTISSPLEGYTNINAKTTTCSTSSCNKVGGSTAKLVLGTGDSSTSGGGGVDGGTDGGNGVTNGPVDPTEQSTADASTILASFIIVPFLFA